MTQKGPDKSPKYFSSVFFKSQEAFLRVNWEIFLWSISARILFRKFVSTFCSFFLYFFPFTQMKDKILIKKGSLYENLSGRKKSGQFWTLYNFQIFNLIITLHWFMRDYLALKEVFLLRNLKWKNTENIWSDCIFWKERPYLEYFIVVL